MGKVRVPYCTLKKGRVYFESCAAMKALGFEPRPLGPDGVEAWAEGMRLYEEYKRVKKGQPAPNEKVYPLNSIGWAWERYRRTEAWRNKALSTRQKDWDWAWKWIEPLFGDVAPSTVEIEDIERMYAGLLRDKGLHTAHRVIKVWRALWRVMAAMKICDAAADPSKIMANAAPKGRTATWSAGEMVRLSKGAWRMGYRGLAALLAVAWDTQLSPIDCRTLTLAMRCENKGGTFFDTSRGKTGKAVIGTLSRRSVWALDAYLASLGADLMEDAIIFRNRSGLPYSPDRLGRDFRAVREALFPKDGRKILDIRRSGAVELQAGEAEPSTMAAKMGNSIDHSRKLQDTYLPKRVQTVRLADEARKRGRRVLGENK